MPPPRTCILDIAWRPPLRKHQMKSPFGARCTPRSCAHALARRVYYFQATAAAADKKPPSEPFASGSAVAACGKKPSQSTHMYNQPPACVSSATHLHELRAVFAAEISHFMWISSLFPWRDQSWRLILLSYEMSVGSTDAFHAVCINYLDAFVCNQLATGVNQICD
jgi:hypothetical protein